MLISVMGCTSQQRNRSIYEAQKSGDYNKLAKELEDARPSRFNRGNKIDAMITELDKDKRKISLSIKALEEKLKSYLHHREFDIEPLSVEKIDKIMGEKKPIYDLKVDQRISKFNKGQKLTTIDLKLLPNYIQNNIEKYKLWLD